jgi:hypothetical protein
MPSSYEIHRDQHIVVVRFWGVLTGEEIDDFRKSLRADPAFDASLRYIIDMRGVTVLAYSSTRVRQAAVGQIFRGPQRRAIVAFSDEQFGVSRMFATFAALEGEVVHVYRRWEQAAEWLELTGALAVDPGVTSATGT